MPVWQRNYYEHVIRTEDEWNEVRTYVRENPLKWELDENHPQRTSTATPKGSGERPPGAPAEGAASECRAPVNRGRLDMHGESGWLTEQAGL
jgi:hypothetical protein